MKVPIYPGSSSFETGSTPFGFYDEDSEFQHDVDRFTSWAARRLGYPIMEVELQDLNFYAAFEEAITLYGNEVHVYKLRDDYLSLEGSPTGSFDNRSIISSNTNAIFRMSRQYGVEAGSGGNVTWHKGNINVKKNQQNYDLNAWAVENDIEGGIEIKRIFHQGPPALMRYFDPHGGTGFGYQGMMSNFGWGSYSPAINFLLMPLSFDIQRIQAIELNDQIRRSTVSFELINNVLKLFPIPQYEFKLWFEYVKMSEKELNSISTRQDNISSILNVPYKNPNYSSINAIGRKWIFDYGLALAKEMLGYIRGKYSTIPIPNQETTLNHSDLISAAEKEKEALLRYLREFLETTSREKLLERRSKESEYKHTEINRVPLPIWIA